MVEIIYLESNLEPVKKLKVSTGLLKESTTDGDSIAKAIANNSNGGSIDMKTGQLKSTTIWCCKSIQKFRCRF